MLAFFFHRQSPVRLVVEAVGATLLVICLLRAPTFALVVLGILYGFIRWCASRRWYSDQPRFAGIELQFLRSVGASGYTFVLLLPLHLAFPHVLWIVLAIVILLFFAHFNVALLLFHRRDMSSTPINFFSSGAFLKDNATRLDTPPVTMIGRAHADMG